MMRTRKGTELANKLRPRDNPHLYVDVDICSAICRAATTYARLQVETCNGHPIQNSPYADIKLVGKLQDRWDRRIEREEKRIEALITRHSKNLPGVKGVLFQGDPRGATVKLVMADGRYDDWGKEGICVPGS